MVSEEEGESVIVVWFKHSCLILFFIVNENIPTDNDRTFLGASHTNKTYNYGFRGGGEGGAVSERRGLTFLFLTVKENIPTDNDSISGCVIHK